MKLNIYDKLLKQPVSLYTEGPLLPSAFSDGFAAHSVACTLSLQLSAQRYLWGPLVGSPLNCMLGKMFSC